MSCFTDKKNHPQAVTEQFERWYSESRFPFVELLRASLAEVEMEFWSVVRKGGFIDILVNHPGYLINPPVQWSVVKIFNPSTSDTVSLSNYSGDHLPKWRC
jgi:hypothetical protein